MAQKENNRYAVNQNEVAEVIHHIRSPLPAQTLLETVVKRILAHGNSPLIEIDFKNYNYILGLQGFGNK